MSEHEAAVCRACGAVWMSDAAKSLVAKDDTCLACGKPELELRAVTREGSPISDPRDDGGA